MPMFFLDKRVQVICDHLKKQAVVQNVRLSGWQYKEGSFLRPADADAAPDRDALADAAPAGLREREQPAGIHRTRRLAVPVALAGSVLSAGRDQRPAAV